MLVNKSLYSDAQGNALRLSSALQTEQKTDFQNFSAKYVVSGNENYTLNNRKITVRQGEYVIGNQHTSSVVLIDAPSPVKGICIDVSKEIITEIMNYSFRDPNPFSGFLFDREWMAQKFNRNDTALGGALFQLSGTFDDLINGHNAIDKMLFYTIAECMIKDQSEVFKSFNSLKCIKEETNGRLFNFLFDAKNYMDRHFLEKINIGTIAREAKLSEYHFIRLFKTIFNTTPYKYIVRKRLHFSLELLKDQCPVSDISVLLGYTDSAAFSNAFKQYFGYPPKQYRIN